MGDLVHLTPPLRVVETSGAGRMFAGPPRTPFIDVCGGLTTTWRVLIDGLTYDGFNTRTNATRCASALNELARIGALPSPEGYPARRIPTTPPGAA